MDESTQQLLALALVALAVGLELLRRYRKKKAGKIGCENCKDTLSGKESQ